MRMANTGRLEEAISRGSKMELWRGSSRWKQCKYLLSTLNDAVDGGQRVFHVLFDFAVEYRIHR